MKSFQEMLKQYDTEQITEHDFLDWFIMRAGDSFAEGVAEGRKEGYNTGLIDAHFKNQYPRMI